MPSLKKLIDTQTDPALLECLFRNVGWLARHCLKYADQINNIFDSYERGRIWREEMMPQISSMPLSPGSTICLVHPSQHSKLTERMNVGLSATTLVASSVRRSGTGIMNSK